MIIDRREKEELQVLAEEIKQYSIEQLEELAGHLREQLVSAVRENGGHLASNLGTVELTLALHKVFDFPQDKLIFDVGHQSYTHKILSGRDISHIRRKGGPSGFADPEESVFDSFISGHSGNSIAAGIGMCNARDTFGEQYKVISVIGDASMGNGLALEAVFSSEEKPKNFIVVLNDNGMAIDKNNSALARALARTSAKKNYRDFNSFMRRTFKETNAFGRQLRKMKYTIKGWLNKNEFFERCGFKYIGPVDGHNLPELIYMLENIKQLDVPILLHAVTVKGKGFEAAEEDPARFHGVGQNFVGSNNSFAVALGRVLCARAQTDPTLVAVTAAMTEGAGLADFASQFPNRFYDVGICEEYAVTMAAGMARGGLSPVVCLYSTFLQRAYDQIVHDVCLQNLPVIFCIDRAGFVGADGKTHQGLFDLSALRAVPNLKIFAPKDCSEFVDMFDYARSLACPVAIRYPNGYAANLGSRMRINHTMLWETLTEGDGVIVLASGARAVGRALDARRVSGLTNVKVINCRTVKPLDTGVLDRYAGHKIITFEEGYAAGGFGSAVAEYYAQKGEAVQLLLLGAPDAFVAHANAQEQADDALLTSRELAAHIRALAQSE